MLIVDATEQEAREHRAGVAALYEVLLGRVATDSSLHVWDGVPWRDVGAAIVASYEYGQRGAGVADGPGDGSIAVSGLRLQATNGLVDLGPIPAAPPCDALKAVPFEVLTDQLPGQPIVRVIGGSAEALCVELTRRGHASVIAGTTDPECPADVLVTTGPDDHHVIASVRPDLLAPVSRLVVPHRNTPAELHHEQAIAAARAALHDLGFAEVVRVFRQRHGGESVIVDVTDYVPPAGPLEMRNNAAVDPPLSTWFVANRVP